MDGWHSLRLHGVIILRQSHSFWIGVLKKIFQTRYFPMIKMLERERNRREMVEDSKGGEGRKEIV